MATYVWNTVLDPPSPMIRGVPVFPDIGKDDEFTILSEFFTAPLPANTTIRYRQKLRPGDHLFLCHYWVYARTKGLLRNGHPFPNGLTWLSDDLSIETSATMEGNLKSLGLIPCADNDPKRMVLLWVSDPHGNVSMKSAIGHIQVLHEGHWESKLSSAQWVLCHDENLFSTWGDPLSKAYPGKRYYKRAVSFALLLGAAATLLTGKSK